MDSYCLHIDDLSSKPSQWKPRDIAWLEALASSFAPNPVSLEPSSKSEPDTDIALEIVDIRCPGYQLLIDSLACESSTTSEAVAQTSSLPIAGQPCKKKSKHDCKYRLCFTCCMQVEAYYKAKHVDKGLCAGHANARAKREEEDRLIATALSEVGRKKNKQFHHFEEKLTDYGQTVLIWYLGDFLRVKKWSEDTLSSLIKQRRQESLRKRREGAFLKQYALVSEQQPLNAPEGVKAVVESSATSSEDNSESNGTEKNKTSLKSKRRGSRYKARMYELLPLSKKAAARLEKVKKQWESAEQFGSTSWILESNGRQR